MRSSVPPRAHATHSPNPFCFSPYHPRPSESPDHDQLEEALLLLFCLGALDACGTITECGTDMSKFPVEPQLARMLLKSADEGCTEEAVIIAAMLSTEVHSTPQATAQAADLTLPTKHILSPSGIRVQSLEKGTRRPTQNMPAFITGWAIT